MSPNPISLAIVVVLAGLGVLAIGLARLVLPGALLILLAVVVLVALKRWRDSGSKPLSCRPASS
jgi:hypothetical protein